MTLFDKILLTTLKKGITQGNSSWGCLSRTNVTRNINSEFGTNYKYLTKVPENLLDRYFTMLSNNPLKLRTVARFVNLYVSTSDTASFFTSIDTAYIYAALIRTTLKVGRCDCRERDTLNALSDPRKYAFFTPYSHRMWGLRSCENYQSLSRSEIFERMLGKLFGSFKIKVADKPLPPPTIY